MRKSFVAGNWKMNTDTHTSVALAERIASDSREIVGNSGLPTFHLPAICDQGT